MPLFTEGVKCCVERLSDLPNVTDLVHGRTGICTQEAWLHSRPTFHYTLLANMLNYATMLRK